MSDRKRPPESDAEYDAQVRKWQNMRWFAPDTPSEDIARETLHPRPFTISHLDHLTVLVDGMERSVRFYEDVLGCTVDARLPHLGMVTFHAGRNEIGLVDISVPEGAWAKPAVAGGSNIDHFALEVHAGPNALRDYLNAHGVDIAEERVEEDSHSFYVSDPSGNKIELLVRRA
jgi:glyoxylase I family protein